MSGRWRRPWIDAALIGLLAAAIGASLAWAERIPVNQGFGWDGEFYGRVAQDVEGTVLAREVDPYRLQRVLPSVVVHIALRIAGQRPTPGAVITAFGILNGILLLAACGLWLLVARALGLGARGSLLGFIGLFANFAIAKHAFYYPVLTDVAAFALGMLMLYLYLTRRSWALLLATVSGAFCWPVAGAIGAILLLFPRRDDAPAPRGSRLLALVGAAATSVLLVGVFVFLYFGLGRTVVGQGPIVPVIGPLVPLSILLFGGYVFAAMAVLLDRIDLRWVIGTIRGIRARDLALAAAALAVPRLVIWQLAAPADGLSARTFLSYLAFLPNTRPGLFFVAHVVYFGPIVLLVALRWAAVARAVRALGAGAIAMALLTIVLSFTPESRQMVLGLPLLVALLAAVVERELEGWTWVWIFGAASVVFSRVWLRINDGWRGDPFDFPRYFMHQGPWMPNATYVINLIIVVMAGVACWALLRRGRERVPVGARAEASLVGAPERVLR